MPKRGSLISYRRIARLSRPAIAAELASARIGPGDPRLGAGAVHNGIIAYRVVSRTVGPSGRLVPASGLVAFPSRSWGALALVEYGHGTTATRADVPSAFGAPDGDGIEGRWTGELFASAGFATVLPDYLGMGVSRLRPQYEVAQSEASASVDQLRATATIETRADRRLDGQVMVTGFSQGGAAAEALAHQLSHGADTQLRLRALAPISGPYELLKAELPGIFDGRADGVESDLPPVHQPVGRVPLAVRSSHRQPVRWRSSGRRDRHQLAGDFRQLITASYLRQLGHPSGRLRRALIANSTCAGWRSKVLVRLYAASGDSTVTEANAEVCARSIRSRGGNARVIQLGAVDHDVSDFLGCLRSCGVSRASVRPDSADEAMTAGWSVVAARRAGRIVSSSTPSATEQGATRPVYWRTA